jgi:hypothetical protein
MCPSFLKNKDINDEIEDIDDEIEDDVEEEIENDVEEEIENDVEEEIEDDVEEEIEDEIEEEIEEEIEDEIEDEIEEDIEEEIEDDIESDIQEIDTINDENIEIELEENNDFFIEDNEIKFQKIIKRRKNIFGYKLINNIKNVKNLNIIENKSKSIQQLRENNRISRSWEEFTKTLLPPLDAIDEPEYRVYRSAKRPSDYFDIDHLNSKIKPIVDICEPVIFFGHNVSEGNLMI